METTACTRTLVERDRASIWHPFTQHAICRPPIAIARGEGAYIFAENGDRYIDGVSSWWTNLHGHAHPFIAKAIAAQAVSLEHVMFADCTHRPAIELAERLLRILPGNMGKIFYSDNGSTAVEVAIKMALQFWYNQEETTERRVVISLRGGYHGDTFGAMSAAGKNPFTRPFWNHLFESVTIDTPLPGQEDASLSKLEAILKRKTAACFIFEPLILSSGGMICYSKSGLNRLIELCQRYNVITIADEAMTGFGRTGPLFACDALRVAPDIICLTKGITGGFLPLAVTACREYIFERFCSTDRSKTFLHGHTYTANPIACRAALASLDLLLTDSCRERRTHIAERHRQFCDRWRGDKRLARCESLGTILVVEWAVGGPRAYFHALRDQLAHFFLDHQILLRPIGNVIYAMPPYCIEEDALGYIYDHIARAIEEVV